MSTRMTLSTLTSTLAARKLAPNKSLFLARANRPRKITVVERGSAVTIRPKFNTGGVNSKIADKRASRVQARRARPIRKKQDAEISRRLTKMDRPARQSAYP